MKLTYLGTAAAEGWPAVFCNCQYCKKAKELGGKNIRTRSQALINNDLLLDFPMDTYHHMLQNGLDLSAVKYCFFTHAHSDHCSPLDLIFREDSCYAHELTEPKIEVFGNERAIERLKRTVNVYDNEESISSVHATEIKAYEPINAGNYKITPLPAYHSQNETPFVYLIESEGKAMLYLHDTGLLFDEVYDYLAKTGVRCDLISYDCTYGALPSGGGHMGLDSVPTVRKRLEEIGVSDENTLSVVNHFSHNGMLLHEEMAEAAAKIGFLCSFDGMVIEF